MNACAKFMALAVSGRVFSPRIFPRGLFRITGAKLEGGMHVICVSQAKRTFALFQEGNMIYRQPCENGFILLSIREAKIMMVDQLPWLDSIVPEFLLIARGFRQQYGKPSFSMTEI